MILLKPLKPPNTLYSLGAEISIVIFWGADPKSSAMKSTKLKATKTVQKQKHVLEEVEDFSFDQLEES